MPRPRLPLTSFEQETFRPVQRLAKTVLVLGVAVALLAFALGYVEIGVVVVLIACAYVGAVWSLRLRMLWVTAMLMSIALVASGYVLGYPLLGALAAVLAVGWIALQVGRVVVDPTTLRRLESDPTDPGSAMSIAEFEALGFERIGALSVDPIPGKTVIANVMLGPRDDRYAVVTDLVLDVVSTFGERWLITRNSATVALHHECLANELRGAAPTELAEAHQSALHVLAAKGLAPDRIRTERLLEAHLELERRSLGQLEGHRLRRTFDAFFDSGLGSGPLDESPASQRRIDAWLGTTIPAALPNTRRHQ